MIIEHIFKSQKIICPNKTMIMNCPELINSNYSTYINEYLNAEIAFNKAVITGRYDHNLNGFIRVISESQKRMNELGLGHYKTMGSGGRILLDSLEEVYSIATALCDDVFCSNCDGALSTDSQSGLCWACEHGI